MPMPWKPSRLSTPPQTVPLRVLLVVPFVVQIFGTVGLVGWLSLRNGQQAVEQVATQLRSEMSDRIDQQVRRSLDVPVVVNRVNANAIQLGYVDMDDPASMAQHFWYHHDLFPSLEVSAIYVGSSNGEFTGLGFQSNQQWEVGRSGNETNRVFSSYSLDDDGRPQDLLRQGRTYDPRLRPWFVSAIQARQPTWTNVYPDFQERRLKVTLAQPLYAENNQLLGVIGTDFVLSHINDLLRSIQVSPSGQTFILDQAGLVIATSTYDDPFVVNGDRVTRLAAVDVPHPLIQDTARYLQAQFPDLSQLERSQTLDFRDRNGRRQLVHVNPVSYGRNLNWMIVVVIPETDFLGQIYDNTRTTVALCLLALLVATLVGLYTARWIIYPIQQLSDASRTLAESAATANLAHPDTLPPIQAHNIAELRSLADAFDQMATELQTSFAVLEQRVEERTAELQEEQQKSEQLLLNILPQSIAHQLKQNQTSIASAVEEATILFADIVDFTPLASRLPPTELVRLLNDIFCAFDHLVEKYHLEKIKTIGDAYMVVGGLPIPRSDHAEAIANIALDMQDTIRHFRRDDGEPFRLRIGINTGPVVAGVIGSKKFIYDLWGDAVNVASRMESHGSSDGIQVTHSTYELLKHQFIFSPRGMIKIKGKGDMQTYWLTGRQVNLESA
jgi:adenylate cyclase